MRAARDWAAVCRHRCKEPLCLPNAAGTLARLPPLVRQSYKVLTLRRALLHKRGAPDEPQVEKHGGGRHEGSRLRLSEPRERAAEGGEPDAHEQKRVAQRAAADGDFVNPLATVDQVGWLGGDIRGKRLLCLAAGGGTVRPGCDLFDLKRIGISDWFRSPYHLGFEMVALHRERTA